MKRGAVVEMVTIAIPVYNEEELITENTEKLIGYMESLGERYEIILCDNGSTDSTPDLGRRLEKRYKGKVRFLSLRRRGVGLAFREAVRRASFNRIISLDMDLSTDLGFIEKALELLEGYDIVVGSKAMGGEGRALYRRALSRCHALLARLLLKLSFSDYSISSKAYRKDAIERWMSSMPSSSAYVLELLYHAEKEGLKVVETPVRCEDRRRSRFKLHEELYTRLATLLKLWLYR